MRKKCRGIGCYAFAAFERKERIKKLASLLQQTLFAKYFNSNVAIVDCMYLSYVNVQSNELNDD